MLLEGTTLSRPHGGIPPLTEAELENQIVGDLKEAPGLVLACFSAQNIDRFVTFYRATRRAERTFIGDAYLSNILSNLGLTSLPVPNPLDLRVFLGGRQRQRIIDQELFDLLNPLRASRIFADEICRAPAKWVMLFRTSLVRDVDGFGAIGPVKLIYSLTPLLEGGILRLPRGAHWQVEFQEEYLAFPHARHDDQVDALTQFLGWLVERRWSYFEADFGLNDVPHAPSGDTLLGLLGR